MRDTDCTGDTYVTSAAAAALDIYVTPTAPGGT